MKLFGPLLVSALCSAVLAGPAAAADSPGRNSLPHAPSPVFTWSGPYVGAHAGYMWGKVRVIDNGVLTESNASTNGVLAGLLAGYNWQRDGWVYGLEGDGSLANARGSGNAVVLPAARNTYNLRWAANLRARLGYSVTPDSLLYVAGGVAFTDLRFREGSGTSRLKGATRTGWTIGAGVEHAFSPNFVGRGEYLYADYGSVNYTVNPGDVYNIGFKAQTVRGALIWKF